MATVWHPQVRPGCCSASTCYLVDSCIERFVQIQNSVRDTDDRFLLQKLDDSFQSVDLVHQRDTTISRDITYFVLQRCTKQKDLAAGRQVHSRMISSGLDSVAALADHLIRLFALHGHFLEANIAFCKVAKPSIHTWHAIISAHVTAGECQRALELYERMQQEGAKPSKFIFSSILKAIVGTGALGQGELIHEQIVKRGIESDMFVGSTLIDMYAKCNCLIEARRVFDNLQFHDVVSWNAMITGYAQCGLGVPALELFKKMHHEGIKPRKITFVSLLKACGNIGAYGQGRLVHDLIIRSGVELDIIVGSTVVDMYVKFGILQEAHIVFDKLASRNVVSWNTMITGCAQHGHSLLALELFERMQQEGILPDKISFLCLLKACDGIPTVEQGRLVHDQIVRNNLESDVVVGSSLIDVYAKCGSVEEAHKLFDKLPTQNVVSWGAMIGGYAHHGFGTSALELFEMMQESSIKPDMISFLCSLKACSNIGDLGKGKLIHGKIIQSGLELDLSVGSTLIEMYAKCGDLETACAMLEELPCRDAVSWCVLIKEYTEQGQGVSALKFFEKMQQDGVKPDNVVFSCILKACGSIGAIGQGKMIHDQVIRSGLDTDVIVGIAVINMYTQYGCLDDAYQVLNKVGFRNALSWNAMIAGYARHGEIKLARKCLEDMQVQGIVPDGVTFTSILAACCHACEVEQGLLFFKSMSNDHGITPNIEHFNCMVDLLGRAGCLNEAEELIQKMPMPPDITGWRSLLASSREFGNIELGRRCFDETVQLDSNSAAGYVLMSSIYADSQMWDDVNKVQERRKHAHAFRKPGRAWIEDDYNVHEFFVGDKSHQHSVSINAKLNRLKRLLMDDGCLPLLNLVLEPMSNDNIVDTLCEYGE